MKYISILIALLTLSCSSGNDEAKIEEPAVGKASVKVMTYNIHIANPPSKPNIVDIAAIADVIIKSNSDLVALEEVDRFTNRSGLDLDQAKAIAERTGMYYYFAKAMNQDGGEIGQAILSKFPIINSETHSLPGADGVAAYLRSVGVVEVAIAEGKNIVFGAVHLDHLTDESRREQSKEMIKFFRAKYPEVPVIVGGDFNMLPSNDIWNLINTNFDRACTSCPATFPATNPTKTIDYFILNKTASASFQIMDYYTISEKYASDHLPLVMRLEYPIE